MEQLGYSVPISAQAMATDYPDCSETGPPPLCLQQSFWLGQDPGPWSLISDGSL